MFVLTVDQIDSRHHDDRVGDAVRDIEKLFSPSLVGAPERTAGDEFQLATERGATALDVALHLARREEWSIGLGVGDATRPLEGSVRAMTGSAFLNAREAVATAKKRPTRFALVADPEHLATQNLDPLIGLLIALRDRRTPEGWELFDLIDGPTGPRTPPLTLTAAAKRLGISVQAASQRALTAGLRLDREARDALATLLDAGNEKIGA